MMPSEKPLNGLFVTSEVLREDLEKSAATKLSRDTNKWEREIMDSLNEQSPFLRDHDIRFHLNKSDPDSGMGVGQVVVDEKLAIPVIIDNLKLQPLDLFWHEGKLNPLSKDSLEGALQPGSLGTVTEPGEGEVSDVSLYGATRVPFSGKYSFAEALTFTEDELNKAIGILGKEGLDYALRTNPAFFGGVAKYARATKRDGVKKQASAALAPAKLVEFIPFEEVKEPGLYTVLFDGIRKMSALVFDKVADWDGEIVPKKSVAYGLDGSFALADEVGGIPFAGDLTGFKAEEPALQDVGFFWTVKGASALATLPGRIMYKGANEDGVPFVKVAELSSGKERTIFVSDDYDGFFSRDGVTFMGTEWNWAKIEKSASVSNPERANENEWPPHTIEIRNRGNLYSVHGLDIPGVAKEGEVIEPFFAAVSKMLNPDDVLVLMKSAEERGSAFASIPVGFSWEEKAAANPYAGLLPDFGLEPVNCVKCAAMLRPTKVEFYKYAAEVNDEDATDTIDTLLGLNFITEENIGKFIEKISTLETARDVLAKTLLSARLGLQVEQGPVKTALFSLDNVIHQLQYLRDYASAM